MIDNHKEYKLMHDVESRHWWYVALHERILTNINEYFSGNNDISILDAGCGTGGTISYLKERGYENIKGFDISGDATRYALIKGCDVMKCSLMDVDSVYDGESFDVVILSDVLYFLNKELWGDVLKKIHHVTSDDSLVLINLPAFNVFSGMHDKAVGISERFSPTDIHYLANKYWICLTNHYWPTIFFPVILFVRTLQRIGMKLNNNRPIRSDVGIGSEFINYMLVLTMRIDKYIVNKVFASSAFIVLKRRCEDN